MKNKLSSFKYNINGYHFNLMLDSLIDCALIHESETGVEHFTVTLIEEILRLKWGEIKEVLYELD